MGLWRFQVAGCAVGREQAGAYLVSPRERPSGGLLEAVFAHNGRRVSAGGFLIAV